jgi:predicted transcriptional regulator
MVMEVRMKPKKFATQIDEDVLRELKVFAEASDRSISKIVTDAISEYLKKAQVRKVFRSAMNEVIDDNEDLLERLAK